MFRDAGDEQPVRCYVRRLGSAGVWMTCVGLLYGARQRWKMQAILCGRMWCILVLSVQHATNVCQKWSLPLSTPFTRSEMGKHHVGPWQARHTQCRSFVPMRTRLRSLSPRLKASWAALELERGTPRIWRLHIRPIQTRRHSGRRDKLGFDRYE